jgi:predicted DNA-binding transcriptional regulator YafY
MSSWQERSTVSERRAAAVLSRLVDARGPVAANDLFAGVPEYPDDPASAAAALSQDIGLLRSYGLEIASDGECGVRYRIAEACWQQRPLVLDDIDAALLDRALDLADTNPQLARAIAVLHGSATLSESRVTVSLSPRGSAARGRPEAYSRLHRLADLMARRVPLAFGYPDASGEVSPRTLRVYGLGESRGVWYAVGTDTESGTVRAFAVSEMRGPVAELPEAGLYLVPESFDLTEQLALSWRLGPDPVTVRVRFDRDLGAYMGSILTHVPLEDCQDEGFEASLPVGDVDAFVGWILSFGTHARILEPDHAVKRAREILERMVHNNA